jgi:hypothetical protein
VIATNLHSNDGSFDISGPLLLPLVIATSYMTSEDYCYYETCGTHAGATSVHNSDGQSDISGPLLLPPTIATNLLVFSVPINKIIVKITCSSSDVIS